MSKYLQYDRDNEIHYYCYQNKVLKDIRAVRLKDSNVIFMVKNHVDTRVHNYKEKMYSVINGAIGVKTIEGQGVISSKDYYIDIPIPTLETSRTYLSDMIEKGFEIIPVIYQ